MSCKIFLALCVFVGIAVALEAAVVPVLTSGDKAVHKLDYDGVHANVWRSSRQAQDDASGEDSDEDDDEDDAEQLQQSVIQQQQAQEQAANASEEASDEDDGDDEEEDDDDDDDDDDEGGFPSFFGRRRRQVDVKEPEITNNDVKESEAANEIEENHKEPQVVAEVDSDADKVPAAVATPSRPSSPNSSVLILIRDAIKKVTTELPNSQQVAASASQYFTLFEHFLQQTIEQVIGDDDDEDEAEATTIVSEVAEEATLAPVVLAPLDGEKESLVAEVEKQPVAAEIPEMPAAPAVPAVPAIPVVPAASAELSTMDKMPEKLENAMVTEATKA